MIKTGLAVWSADSGGVIIEAHALIKLGTLRQFEIFAKVAELGSIVRAAEQLHLTQPSVSMQIKKLADAVGLPLYDVIGRRLQLTEAGHAVANASREIFHALDRMDAELNNLKGLHTGNLRIAVVTTAKYFLPHVLRPFCERYPGINVEFKIGNRDQILERLHRNLDDLYIFSHPPADLDITCYPLLPNPLVVIASKDHPLAGKKLRWGQLENERFILREPGSGTLFSLEQQLQTMGYELPRHMAIESNQAIKHTVMANMGISVLSAYTLVNADIEGLVQLEVQGFPIMTQWHLVHMKARVLSRVAQGFYDFIVREGRSYLPMEKIEARVRAAKRGTTTIG